MKILVNTKALKTQMNISQSMMEKVVINQTQALEGRKAMLPLSYLCLSEGDQGSLSHIRLRFVLTIVIASSY